MTKLHAAVAPALVVALFASACGDSDSVPLAPTALTAIPPGPNAALDAGPLVGFSDSSVTSGLSGGHIHASNGPDGVTLKASAPEPVSPIDGDETADIQVTLVAANAGAPYVDVPVPFTYRFELFDAEMAPVHTGTAEQGMDTTSYAVPQALENDKEYRWRVRAEYDGHAGPWSGDAMFRTPVSSIGTPTPISPADGATDVWPVILTVINGETSGRVGRVVMTFEVAADPGFGTLVKTVRKAAGAGRTRVELSAEGLDPETTYYWRVIARDDMGIASDYSARFSFVTSAVTIDPPIPTDPVNGARNLRKPIVLQVTNGATRGPVGVVTMTFEIATDSAFGAIVDKIEQRAGEHDLSGTGRSSGGSAGRKERTSVQPSVELEAGTTYFWRVIARDDEGRASQYSTTFQFTTARASAPTPGGGTDDIDVSEVTWLHTNVGGWPATSTITDVRIRDVPAGGICINHTKANVWPGTRTQGGPNLAGNPWVFGKVNGRWYAATYEWLRPGQICKLTVAGGHGKPSDELAPHIKRPPLDRWVPRSGEMVGFMVSTPARFGPEGPIRERSNIKLVRWP